MKADAEGTDWIVNEFSGLDFGDERLANRFILTAQRLSKMPQAPINQACASKAETKGAYRMFANEAVDEEEIVNAHQYMTGQRMKDHKIVLAVQDTTFINFDGHEKTKGLGSIGKSSKIETAGIILHSSLVLTPAGTPLGLLSHRTRIREFKPKEARADQKRKVQEKSIELKESYKWLEALDDTIEWGDKGVKVVTIGDRESDIYEFIAKATFENESFVIRNCFNRKTEDGHLFDALSATKIQGTHTIQRLFRQGYKKRDVELDIRFTKVTLQPSQRIKKAQSSIPLVPIEVYVIEAKERKNQVDRIHWILLTSEPILSLEDAKEKLAWYTKRWSIEVYHKILKSGCKIEDCRLQSADKLRRYISLKAVIAVRLYQLTMRSREDPDLPCTSELTDTEWKVLFLRTQQTKKLPKKPPTLKQVVSWLGILGGFMNRKSDGQPGPIVIWRGWQLLQECIKMTEALKVLN